MAKYQDYKYPAIVNNWLPAISFIFNEGAFGIQVSLNVTKYSPVDYRDEDRVDFQYKVSNGKVLQYQPAEHCAGTAEWKLWAETQDSASHRWSPPYPGQWIYTQNQQLKAKREDGGNHLDCGVCSPDTCGCDNSCGRTGTDIVGGFAGGNTSNEVARLAMDPSYAPRRVSEPPDGQWAEPANYRDGDVGDFMRGEVAMCHLGETAVAIDPRGTASYVVEWEESVDSAAIEGLWGCTAVILVSRRGSLLLHSWESPVFTRYDRKTHVVSPPLDADWERFVTVGLRYNDHAMYPNSTAGICNLRKDSDEFVHNHGLNDEAMELLNNDANPQVRIHTMPACPTTSLHDYHSS